MSRRGWKAQLCCVLLSVALVCPALVPIASIIGGSIESDPPTTGAGGGSDERSVPRATGPFYKVIEGPEGDMGFGKAVNNLGDTNGDGTDDLMVIRGGPYGNGTQNQGPYGPENYLLPGSLDGIFDGNNMTQFDGLAWTFSVGDLNGDGLADCVSTRYPMKYPPMAWQVNSTPATLEIRYGVSSGLPLSPHATIELKPVAIPLSKWSTLAVKGVGDVNGDGFDDLLVISNTYDYSQDRLIIGSPAPQEISLYYGSEDGLMPTPGWSRAFPADERYLWYILNVIKHADLNGDGHSDVVFCFRPHTDIYPSDYYHRIAVHYGSTSGLSLEPDWVASGSRMDEYIPKQVRVGRFDGDDVDDLMVLDDAYGQHPVPTDNTGWRMRIFRGSVDGIGDEPDDTMFFPKGWKGRFFTVADMNGDGLEDLINTHIGKLPPLGPFGGRETVPTRYNISFKVDINIDGRFQALDTVHYRFTSLFGDEVTSCTRGDIDGDGLDDIVLGIIGTKDSSISDDLRIFPGKVLVLFGSGFSDVQVPLQVLDGPRLYSEYKAYDFLVSDSSRGSPLPNRIKLTLDPGGENVELGWRYRQGSSDIFDRSDTDNARLESSEEDVVREPDTGSTKVDFRVIFGWSWSHEDPCDAVVEIIDGFGFVRHYPLSCVFSVENDLDFAGETQIYGEVQGRISDGDWVAGGELVFVEGVKVVYEGTDSVYPPEGVCNVALEAEDLYNVLVPNGPNGSFETSLMMGNETDPEVNITLMARDLPGTAQMASQRRFTLGVDADLPEFRNAVPDGTDWIGTSSVKVAITVDDTGTSGVDTSSLEYSFSINGTMDYQGWTRRNLETTPEGPIVDGVASLELFDGAYIFLRWRVKDLVGNGYVVSRDITFRVNMQAIQFSKPVPPEDQWNAVRELQCGVTIRDLGGEGVDVGSVEYRVSHDNISHYGPWTPWNVMSTDHIIIDPRVTVLVEEGPFNFVQWRARGVAGIEHTASAHYCVMADTTPITFRDFLPTGIQNTSELNVSVLPSDGLLGCGVEWSTLEYRFRTGPGPYSVWQKTEIVKREGDLELDEEGNRPGWNGEWIAQAHLVGLVEGGENFVQFRGLDEIANGPAISEEYRITVDTLGPEFLRIAPGPGEVLKDPLVTMTVLISDDNSGVDLTSVSYRFGTDGESSMGEWGNLTVDMVDDGLQGSVSIALSRGRTNVVQFRCLDLVGNMNVSDIVGVWVNMIPIGRISTPREGAEYDVGTLLSFNAEGSEDPDGDVMEYEWYIESETSPFALGKTAEVKLPTGPYNITLLVRDEHGGEDRTTVHFLITSPDVGATSTLGSIMLLFVIMAVVAAAMIWVKRRDKSEGREIAMRGPP